MGNGTQQRLGQLEGHAHPREVRIGILPKVGMHHRAGGGQLGAQGVVVRDHPVEPQLPAGRHLRQAAHAAVHGDEQARIAGGLQFLDAVQVQPIAI